MSDDPLFPFNSNIEPEQSVAEPKKRGRPKTDKARVEETPPIGQLLSEADLIAIREEAQAHVAADFKKEERKKVFERMVVEERMKYAPEEELISTLIDLPGHAKAIVINGREYVHGATYDVPISLHRSMAEIMYRAWQHEDVVGGVNRDTYIKPPRNMGLRPGMENFQHPNSSIMRV